MVWFPCHFFATFVISTILLIMRFPQFIVLSFIFSFILSNCDKEDLPPNNGRNNGRNDQEEVEQDPLAWTQSEKDTILADSANTKMRLYTIFDYNDSLTLRKQSIDVHPDSTDEILMHLIDRLYQTVQDPSNPGVGIAAPQIGINRNVIWVQRADKPGQPFEVYLNPVIVQVSAYTVNYQEGCLSIPGQSGLVTRPFSLYLEYDRLDGTDTSEVIMNQHSSVRFQHEIDHLNGILYIDYLDSKKKSEIQKKIDEITNSNLNNK